MKYTLIINEIDEVVKLYQKESFELCLQRVEKILRLEKNNYDALSYKGACLKNLHFYHDAIKTFNQCIKLRDNDSFIWVFKGDCHFKLEDYEQAIHDYYRALIIDPTNTAVEDQVGRAMFLLGNIEESILIMKHVIKKGDSPEPLLVLLTMLNTSGRDVEALEIACLGEELFPDEKRFSKFFQDSKLTKKSQLH